MRICGVTCRPFCRAALSAILALTVPASPVLAQAAAKPTGAPLALSNIETEQPIPLVSLSADGKTATCSDIRLHWISKPDVGPNDDAASFTIDLPAENPSAPLFQAQLWNASLASAMAWQQPWEGARWKVLDVPVTDGSGLDAALAVGMIATSARRPYPPKTVVIGSLNPDGSLGPVSRLLDRLNAAEAAGMKRAIIPSVQRFDTDTTGQVVNLVRHAADAGLEVIPVDDVISATETVMNDPLPDSSIDATLPKYNNEVAAYIDDYAQREQAEAASGLQFAPKEEDLAAYPAHLGAIWKSVYLDIEAAKEAYSAGQVYVAYQLFARANGRMNGANALSGQTRASFDVKTALAESDQVHDQLHALMTPPSIDHGDLQSAVVVAEMADWAFDVNAALEGAQLVTKQAFSVRSDATDAEKDRARESILFANAECKYLLGQAGFYTGLLGHVARGTPINVDANAAHLLPQLIPAQLATARSFTDGIRFTDLRDGLLFDPRLVAYVNVLRQEKADWDARLRKKENAEAGAANPAAPANAQNQAGGGPVQLNSHGGSGSIGFDPGTTYQTSRVVVTSSNPARKVSDPALCLIWVNQDCEIATLDEKYLRLNGAMDASTHEWKVKDHARLDALLQMAEIGARRGIAFAAKTEIDPSVLAMIYEKAAHQRTRGNDASSLDALRNFWRCALLGNMCWQLAHTRRAAPVTLQDIADVGPPKPPGTKGDKKAGGKTAGPASTNAVVAVSPKGDTSTNAVSSTPPATAVAPPPEPPEPTNVAAFTPPAPAPVPTPAPTPTPAPQPAGDEPNIPVAPIAAHQDFDAVPPAPAPAPAPTPTPTPVPTPAPQPAPPTVSVAPPVAVPVAPIATNMADHPAAPVVVPVAPPAPPDDGNVPVAPIAKDTDLNGEPAPATNAAPIGPLKPAVPSDNADGRGGSF